MPFRRRRKRRMKRRKRRSKRSKRSITSLILRGPTIFPDRYHCRCQATFATRVVLTGSVTTTQHAFTVNALRDPFGTASSNNPLGFTQLMTLYQNYRVNAAKLSIILANDSIDVPLSVAIIPSIVDTARDIGSVTGARYVTQRTVGTATGPSNMRMNSYMPLKTLVADPAYNNSLEYVGASAINPATLLYMKVVIEPVGGVNAAIFIVYSVRYILTFWVTFFERVQINN